MISTELEASALVERETKLRDRRSVDHGPVAELARRTGRERAAQNRDISGLPRSARRIEREGLASTGWRARHERRVAEHKLLFEIAPDT